MYEKLDECPSCGHPKQINHIICEDHANTKESFALVRCPKCELVYTNPRPTIDQIGQYYQFDNYVSHTNKNRNPFEILYTLARSINQKNKIRLIHALKKKGTLLDYGCGTGEFLDYSSRHGFNPTGIEPNNGARAKAMLKISNIYKSIEDIKGKNHKFDIITAWHVIEHVHELKPTIKQLKKKLKKDGFLLVAVPNINSFDAEHYKEFWSAYDVPRHLYHFSRSSMASLALKTKLKLHCIRPMKLDSFYVSLLSEKYRESSNQLINAIRTAITSNKKAKTTGEYSSLIYIFHK